MKTIPLSEAKATLSEVADDVVRTHDRVMITRNGRPVSVLIAPEDLEGMEATIELLSDPDARRRIIAAEEEFDAGEGLDEQAVRALLASRRTA